MSTVPEPGEVLTHQHYIFRKTGTAWAQSKTDMVAYLGGVHTFCVDAIIMLLHVTINTSHNERKLDRLKSEFYRMGECFQSNRAV